MSIDYRPDVRLAPREVVEFPVAVAGTSRSTFMSTNTLPSVVVMISRVLFTCAVKSTATLGLFNVYLSPAYSLLKVH